MDDTLSGASRPATTDLPEVERYLTTLYPDLPAEAWLVVSWLTDQRQWQSRWFFTAMVDQVAPWIVEQARRTNVYLNLGLRHPDCAPDPDARGTSTEVIAIPGLWMEFDHTGGAHASPHLPSPDVLLDFIQALPFTFSLLVDSSGGYHGYALFKEPWMLDTPDEHQAATLLLKRFQRTIQVRAAEQGFRIDTTSDLARVLRPAGTLNYKTGTPRPVTILHDEAARYNPSDLAEEPWLATIEDTYTPPARNGTFPPTQLVPIVEGCAWLRHCRDDAATLPEPEWYGMLGIVGRTVEGETTAHAWSTPYPRYSQEETARKLTHALASAGPATCSAIRYDRGGEPYCRDCQHWKRIKSPVVLGMPTRTRPKARTAKAVSPPAAPAQRQADAAPQKAQKAAPPPDTPHSDAYNAECFVAEHGPQLHYCPAWTSWLLWTATHWQKDDLGAVMPMARRTVKRMVQQAEATDDAFLRRHAVRSLSTSALRALLVQAQSMPPMPIRAEACDTHPWLLNCPNGTLNLKTMDLQPHAKTDLITKCLTIAYKPEAICPRWERFLWRAMGGTPAEEDESDLSEADLMRRVDADARATELVAYLQRIVGYSLTGSTAERCLFVLWGETNTGKSTFLAICRAVLGPYGQQADMESFMHKERTEIRNDLAALAGSRLVCALEGQEGRRLNEALVKQLTGGVDHLTARFLHQEYFEFRPEFKIFLATNHRPAIRESGNAIWGRLRPIEFAVPITEEDDGFEKDMAATFQGELEGILAWAVRGCLQWQAQGGLKPPQAVLDATLAWRGKVDTVGSFIQEACLVHASVRERSGVLHAAYIQWCQRHGARPVSLTAFGNDLAKKGFHKQPSGGIWRLGLALLDTPQTPEDVDHAV